MVVQSPLGTVKKCKHILYCLCFILAESQKTTCSYCNDEMTLARLAVHEVMVLA